MKVKMILPALTEAISPYFRPIKYSLFPPLGLATLAGYLHEDDQVTIQDEHVEKLDLNDDPELVVIQVYITSAYRAWDLYDTRHVVYHPAKLTPETLEAGYWRAYRDFYRWGSIFQGAWTKERWSDRLQHVAYAAGWKKFESAWDFIIKTKRASSMLPVLETVLTAFGSHTSHTML